MPPLPPAPPLGPGRLRVLPIALGVALGWVLHSRREQIRSHCGCAEPPKAR
jgi:hypothetical protein